MFASMVMAAALFFTVGGIFMKLSEGLTKFWPTVIVFALFVIGTALQTLAMKREDLAVTYSGWWGSNRSSPSASCCSAKVALRRASPASCSSRAASSRCAQPTDSSGFRCGEKRRAKAEIAGSSLSETARDLCSASWIALSTCCNWASSSAARLR